MCVYMYENILRTIQETKIKKKDQRYLNDDRKAPWLKRILIEGRINYWLKNYFI